MGIRRRWLKRGRIDELVHDVGGGCPVRLVVLVSYEPCEACGRPARHWGLCDGCETEEREGDLVRFDGYWRESPAVLDEEEFPRVA